VEVSVLWRCRVCGGVGFVEVSVLWRCRFCGWDVARSRNTQHHLEMAMLKRGWRRLGELRREELVM
jgi:hypothetical protein